MERGAREGVHSQWKGGHYAKDDGKRGPLGGSRVTFGVCISGERGDARFIRRKRVNGLPGRALATTPRGLEETSLAGVGGPVAWRVVIDGAMAQLDGDEHHRHLRAGSRHGTGVGGRTMQMLLLLPFPGWAPLACDAWRRHLTCLQIRESGEVGEVSLQDA
jgi:hypothetical protein